MGDLVKCPIDGTSLVMMPDKGVAETTCHRCKRAYRVTRGTVVDVKATSDGVRLDLSLVVRADGEAVQMKDTVFAERFGGLSGNASATVVEQLGPDDAYQLVEIRREFSADQQLREPGDRAAIRTVGLSIRGTLVTIFAMVLAMYFYHWAFVFLLVPGAAITTIIAVVAWKRRTTRQKVEPLQLERLQREQWLLDRLEHYRLQAAEVDERLQRYRKQMNELQALDDKMAAADGDFSQRRHVVQRGLDALRNHSDNDERLRDAIASTMEMVEIEYRASRVLDHLPDAAIDRLSTSIAELDAIEAENQELEAQLEANAEVNAIAPA